MKSVLSISGYPTLWSTDQDGHILRIMREKNLVVQNGKNYFAQRAFDASRPPITSIAVGSSNIESSLSDNALYSEIDRKSIFSQEISDNIISYAVQFEDTEAVGSINEVGLFLSDGTMICRTKLSSTFVKANIDFLNINWAIQFG